MTAPAGRLPQGAIAQLVERVLCKHEVVGSIPSGSTIHFKRVGLTGILTLREKQLTQTRPLYHRFRIAFGRVRK